MKYLLVLILLLFSNNTSAQSQLLLKNIKTGKGKSIAIGKNIGILSESDTVVNYEGYSLNKVTDSTIVVKNVNNLYRKYRIENIQSVQVRNSDNESSPLSIGLGGGLLVAISPFAGIEKGGYNFKNAGSVFGIGAGLLGVTHLLVKGRKLKNYQVMGVK